ncbi:MAG: tetratricopeptide repeat protein, partial [Actinomycetia bacterium]|nr:tetratricopeptide repeat protein [Actinomycetes bacterium]
EKNIKLEKSVELAKRALLFEPENSAYLDTMGWAQYKLGNYEKALKFIESAVRIDMSKNNRSDPVILEHLGDIYFKTGEKEKALLNWKKAYRNSESEELKNKIDNADISK